jgi:hypothetical protein
VQDKSRPRPAGQGQRALRRSLLIVYTMLKQGCSYLEIEKVEKDTTHHTSRRGRGQDPGERCKQRGAISMFFPRIFVMEGGREQGYDATTCEMALDGVEMVRR